MKNIVIVSEVIHRTRRWITSSLMLLAMTA